MLRSLAALLLLALALAGCGTAPEQNIAGAALPSSAPYAKADVRSAVLRAGGVLGWRMHEESPGHVVGRIAIDEHLAIIEVTYDEKSYGISYRDSTNLKYDGKRIQKDYNQWVRKLRKRIDHELQTL